MGLICVFLHIDVGDCWQLSSGVASGWTGWTITSGPKDPGGPPPKWTHWFGGPSLFLVHGLPRVLPRLWNCEGWVKIYKYIFQHLIILRFGGHCFPPMHTAPLLKDISQHLVLEESLSTPTQTPKFFQHVISGIFRSTEDWSRYLWIVSRNELHTVQTTPRLDGERKKPEHAIWSNLS